MGRGRGERRGGVTYARWEVQAERDGTGDAALSRSVGADDHVEVGAGLELDVVVGNEVVEFDADDGAGDIAIVDEGR